MGNCAREFYEPPEKRNMKPGVAKALSYFDEKPLFPKATTREEFLKWRQDLIDYKPER